MPRYKKLLKKHFKKEEPNKFELVFTLCGVLDKDGEYVAKDGEEVTCRPCLKKKEKEKSYPA